jgi:hypothetical protein
LAADLGPLRDAIVAVSNQAFGTDTSPAWNEKFTERFLGELARFYVLEDGSGELIGWSGYRARTIAGERVVYFASTGLLPRFQGLRLIPAVQLLAVADEARRHPTRPVTLAVRTRSPHAYRLAARTFGDAGVAPTLDGAVPPDRRAFAQAMAAWIGPEPYDPATSVVAGAYRSYGALYGDDPRSGHAEVDALFGRLGPDDALLVFGCGAVADARVPSPP